MIDIDIYDCLGDFLASDPRDLDEFEQQKDDGDIQIITCGTYNGASASFDPWDITPSNLYNTVLRYAREDNDTIAWQQQEDLSQRETVEMLTRQFEIFALRDTKAVYLILD